MKASKHDTVQSGTLDRIIDMASGMAPKDDALIENRGTRRLPCGMDIAIVQRTPDGSKTISTIVHGVDISPGGIRVRSRYMLHVGYQGAALIARSDGERVIVGIRVVHCRYIGDCGHESGLEFLDSADGFTFEDFVDQQGNSPRLSHRAAA